MQTSKMFLADWDHAILVAPSYTVSSNALEMGRGHCMMIIITYVNMLLS